MVVVARPPPSVQSDQLIATGADSSPATSLSLSIYNLLLYGTTPYYVIVKTIPIVHFSVSRNVQR